MARDPARTARRAFALACRAELPEGQRAAALNRGMALIEKFGLDPDDFDIPGRSPSRPRIDDSKFARFDHDSPPEEMTGTSWRRYREWTIIESTGASIHPFKQAIRDFGQRAADRAAARNAFETSQRDQQIFIRTQADNLGRGRMRVVRNELS